MPDAAAPCRGPLHPQQPRAPCRTIRAAEGDEGKECGEEKKNVDREDGREFKSIPVTPTIDESKSKEELKVSKMRARESVIRRTGAIG